MPRRASKKRATPSDRGDASSSQRLQRLLASAGYGSRRKCEELIEAGRVDVDGQVVTKLGTTVNAAVQKIAVDGVALKKRKLVYYAVHKPVGVVTTNRDPQGRPRVVDLVPPVERVFPVGRLDRSSEGLILLTNDGELAQRLTHPKFGVRKIYRVTVAGKVSPETMKAMRKGIHIAEGFVRVEGAKLVKARGRATEMEITLREGKNREIRRILARLGHKVQQLRRIAVGPLRLGDVPPGAYRVLLREEVDKLWNAVDAAEAAAKQEPPAGTGRGPRKATKKSRGGTSQRNKSAGGRPAKRAKARGGTPEVSGTSGIVIGADPTPTPNAPRKRPAKSKRGRTEPRASGKGSRPKYGRSKSATSGRKAGPKKRKH